MVASNSSYSSETNTSLKNKPLLLFLRFCWTLLFLFGFILCILGYIQILAQMNEGWDPEFIDFLTGLGVSPRIYSLYYIVLNLLIFLLNSFMAIFIFWRRSDDWMVFFISIGIFYGNLALDNPIFVSEFWGQVIYTSGLVPLLIICFTFPTGRIFPPSARYILPLLVVILIVVMAYLASAITIDRTINEIFLSNLLLVLIFALGLLAQLYRFLRVSTPQQRQQTKWVIFGGVLFLIARGFFIIFPLFLPDYFLIGEPFTLAKLIISLIFNTIAMISTLFFPISVVFSILRYRLWDIDIVINRSIVGFFISIILSLIFVLSVFLIQGLLGSENILLSFSVSAAIPALLFQPTHKRVRHFVDHRIYGFKFDLNQIRASHKKPEIKNAGALTGKHLGRYEVLDAIGRGGMGEVYKGFCDGQIVALKTLPDNLAQMEEFVRRFEREAEVMQKLEHPCIVKLYETGKAEGVHYIALEFIEGNDLKSYIQAKGKLKYEDAIKLLQDISTALEHLHKHGIVHRDIKPANIMLRQNDPAESILMDFGIAKIEDNGTRFTGTGMMGTIDYMAPEQMIAAKEVDARADIYALGVTVYEMLTAQRPFKGSTVQVMFAHLNQPVPNPRSINSKISEKTAQAILKALEKKPEDRFSSVGDFVAALS